MKKHLAVLTFTWTRRNILMTFKGPATRSIHLLELRFHWSNQVDFMRHIIWMSVAQSHVINRYTGGCWSLSQQRVCCCVDRKAEAWIKVSSLWDPNRPLLGEQNHIHGTQELIHIRLIVLLLFFTWGIWGCYFVDSQDSDWINEPAVLYFFLLSGIYI